MFATFAVLIGLLSFGGLAVAPASAEESTGAISGRVTDLDDNPLSGFVEVHLTEYEPGFVPLIVATSSDGTYLIENVPVGEYHVLLRATGHVSEYYDDDPATPTVVLVQDSLETAGIDASLRPLLGISGNVTDPGGEPLEGFAIELFDVTDSTFPVGHASTKADGSFEVFAEPGQYRLRVSKLFSGHAARWWDGAYTMSTATTISLSTSDVVDIDVQLEIGGSVTGIIYDIDGDPYPNAYVQLFDERGYVNGASADENGAYQILGAGTGPHYVLGGNNPGFALSGTTEVETVVGQVTPGIDVVIGVPVTVESDSATTAEDTSVEVDVLGNDVGTAASTLAISSNPSKGTATIVDGKVRYTPDANVSGSDEFEYEVCGVPSDCESATATITITAVNDAPTSGSDGWNGVADEKLVVAAPGVLANDADIESTPLSAIVAAGPSKGTVVLKSNGSFTYTPAARTCGTDSFTYRSSDGVLTSAPATVTLTIECAPRFDGTIAQAETMDDVLAASDYAQAQDASTLRLYRAFFDRDPDIDGVQYWLEVSRQGTDYDTMAWSFANSDEFKLTYGGVSDQRFLEILYSNVLGRGTDPDGFAYWLGQMEDGLAPHLVVRWVAAGTEFENRFPYAAT